MAKDDFHPIVKCPHCGADAMMNYKGRPNDGKCCSLKCHKIFRFIKK
jgi:hypothetical protein